MSRSPSPNLDNPFDTPTSTRPPSLLNLPYDSETPSGGISGDEQAKDVLHLSRPSTSGSMSAGDPGFEAATSGVVRYHLPSRPSSTSGSISSDSAGNGIMMVPRANRMSPTAQQPFIPSILNSWPNSARTTSMAFNMPSESSPLAPSSAKKIPRMPSHLIPEGEPVSKPWAEKPHPRTRVAYFLTYAMIAIGFIGGIVQSYFKFSGAQLDRQPLCLVFEEDFNNEDQVFGPNGTFFREVSMGSAFGTGEFEMTTASTNNSYVQDGYLYIVPTLTADNLGWDAIFNGTVFNITGCTFNETRTNSGFITEKGAQIFDQESYLSACSAVSNATSGSIISPVQSARVTTVKSANIRFGRVEIRAKMPTGDWLWPALWMLPVNSTYGPWPASGEIDMVESRGNGITYTARGSNYVQGSLNWGPTPALNGVSKTYSWWSNRRKSFGSEFHTYTLEWTEKWMRVYVDSRLHTLLDISFAEPFFKRGNFPSVIQNGSTLEPLQNPWVNGSVTNAAPFDQEFYLILNVAVGGTTGWFPDWQGNKPWINGEPNPMLNFAKAYTQWYPTWPAKPQDRGMVVDYVKMWKHCDGK